MGKFVRLVPQKRFLSRSDTIFYQHCSHRRVQRVFCLVFAPSFSIVLHVSIQMSKIFIHLFCSAKFVQFRISKCKTEGYTHFGVNVTAVILFVIASSEWELWNIWISQPARKLCQPCKYYIRDDENIREMWNSKVQNIISSPRKHHWNRKVKKAKVPTQKEHTGNLKYVSISRTGIMTKSSVAYLSPYLTKNTICLEGWRQKRNIIWRSVSGNWV